MIRPNLPLNALRAFEAAARHLSFTRAAEELCVTQAAVSHQVKGLEENLGLRLFRRLPRGLALTDEGLALLPVLEESFGRIGAALGRFEGGHYHAALTVGVVGTFALGWLLPRLAGFQAAHPFIDLRLLTNNNRVDLAGEGLDCAIRFGDGAWHGTEATRLLAAPLAPVCTPGLAARLRRPADLLGRAAAALLPHRGMVPLVRRRGPRRPGAARHRLRQLARHGRGGGAGRSASRCCRCGCSPTTRGWHGPSPSRSRRASTG